MYNIFFNFFKINLLVHTFKVIYIHILIMLTKYLIQDNCLYYANYANNIMNASACVVIILYIAKLI